MKENELNIGIFGCSGRMGRSLLAAVINANNCQLSGGLVAENSDSLGKDLGQLAGLDDAGVLATADITDFVKSADVIIDFTSPESTLECAEICVKHQTPLVVGTTGMSESQLESLNQYGQKIPIVFASNMSVGINLLLGLVQKVAATLDDSIDIEIVEMHHRKKVDSPSGTALSLGEAAANGRQVKLQDVACYAREGQIGARPQGEIGFATLRGGDVVGEHSVIFADIGERIELTHKASDRGIFANGAVRAAKWLVADHHAPKLYSMQDVLGL